MLRTFETVQSFNPPEKTASLARSLFQPSEWAEGVTLIQIARSNSALIE